MPFTLKHMVVTFLFLLLSVFACSLCMTPSFAVEVPDAEEEWNPINDTCESKWDAENKTVTVRPKFNAGEGKLSINSAPWRKYSDSVEIIEIEGKIVVSSCSTLFSELRSLREIRGLTNLDTSSATSMSGMFYLCESLESLDLSAFDTSNVKDMTAMFHGCSSLKQLDLSSFDTSNVTKMCSVLGHSMFYGCYSLESIDVSGFNTANVERMSDLFAKCYSLRSLDLSSFDTSSVTTMHSMFQDCALLESICLEGFDTRTVTEMDYMFAGCRSLASIDLSSFDTCSVKSFEMMFYDCESLKTIDLSNFDTSKASNMGFMFSKCHSIESLDLSKFKTSNLKGINKMFYGCGSLRSIDLSHFDTSNVDGAYGLFKNCYALQTVDISNFKISKSCNFNNMFMGCRNLSYLDLSNFDTTEFDVETIEPTNPFEVFPLASDYPEYTIKIGPKFTLQPYLTMGYWSDDNGTWYEEYEVPSGVSGTHEYRYRGKIKSIRFAQNPYKLKVGFEDVLPVSIISRGRIEDDQIWTSSNPEVVSVKLAYPHPVLYPFKSGKATIYVTSISSGITASCEVSVTSDSVESVSRPGSGTSGIQQLKLEKVSIKNLVKAKRGFTVKWSKLSSKYLKQIIGYKIKYSTFKSMKKPKTKTVKASSSNGKKRALKVTNLKSKKKYYVQIATYKKVGDKTYYSKWSKVKSVKTK